MWWDSVLLHCKKGDPTWGSCTKGHPSLMNVDKLCSIREGLLYSVVQRESPGLEGRGGFPKVMVSKWQMAPDTDLGSYRPYPGTPENSSCPLSTSPSPMGPMSHFPFWCLQTPGS